MNTDGFLNAVASGLVKDVNFIESGCGPIVMQVVFETPVDGNDKLLIRDQSGQVLTLKALHEGYEICRLAGLRKANLLQTIPHDEACAGSFSSYDQSPMVMRF